MPWPLQSRVNLISDHLLVSFGVFDLTYVLSVALSHIFIAFIIHTTIFFSAAALIEVIIHLLLEVLLIQVPVWLHLLFCMLWSFSFHISFFLSHLGEV